MNSNVWVEKNYRSLHYIYNPVLEKVFFILDMFFYVTVIVADQYPVFTSLDPVFPNKTDLDSLGLAAISSNFKSKLKYKYLSY